MPLSRRPALLFFFFLAACSVSPDPIDTGDMGQSDVDGDGTLVITPSDCPTAASSSTAPADDPVTTGTTAIAAAGGTYNVTVDGVARRADFHVPANKSLNAPLVIAFHSTGQVPAEWLTENSGASSALVPTSDSAGFVVVAPVARGESTSEFPRTAANCDNASAVPGPFCDVNNPDHEYPGGTDWDIVHTDANTNNDLKLVRILIQRAKIDLGIDPSRVYVMGFSNGGFMAHFTAMVLHDRIAAFAQVASGVIRCGFRSACIGDPPRNVYVNPREADVSVGTGACATIMSLSDYNWTDCQQTCTTKKMASLPTSGHIPHGFIVHDDSDDTVPPRYSCDAQAELGTRAKVRIDKGLGHALPDNFGLDAWRYMSCFNVNSN